MDPNNTNCEPLCPEVAFEEIITVPVYNVPFINANISSYTLLCSRFDMTNLANSNK
jgi:hypothetical protein